MTHISSKYIAALAAKGFDELESDNTDYRKFKRTTGPTARYSTAWYVNTTKDEIIVGVTVGQGLPVSSKDKKFFLQTAV